MMTTIAATPEVVDYDVVKDEDAVVGTTNLTIQRILVMPVPIRITIIIATVIMTSIIIIIITINMIQVDSMEDIIIMTRVDGVGMDSMVAVLDIIAILVEVAIIEKKIFVEIFKMSVALLIP